MSLCEHAPRVPPLSRLLRPQPYWATAVPSLVVVNRSVSIEPSPGLNPLPVWDHSYVNGKVVLVGPIYFTIRGFELRHVQVGLGGCGWGDRTAAFDIISRPL